MNCNLNILFHSYSIRQRHYQPYQAGVFNKKQLNATCLCTVKNGRKSSSLHVTTMPSGSRTYVDWVDTNMTGRERGDDCGKGPQVGYKLWATAARAQPLYMVNTLCQPSFCGAPSTSVIFI